MTEPAYPTIAIQRELGNLPRLSDRGEVSLTKTFFSFRDFFLTWIDFPPWQSGSEGGGPAGRTIIRRPIDIPLHEGPVCVDYYTRAGGIYSEGTFNAKRLIWLRKD